MQLTLEADEARILKDVLTQYLSELSLEIGSSEDYELRQELHRRRDVVQKVIAQVDQQVPQTG
jgi:hypothetical protein